MNTLTTNRHITKPATPSPFLLPSLLSDFKTRKKQRIQLFKMQSNRKLKNLKFLTETDRWVYIKAAKNCS